MEDQPTPKTEVRRRRRTFSLSYKRRILDEYESSTRHGDKGAILRREGLYDSQISAWRLQMAKRKPKNNRRPGRPARTSDQRTLLALQEENRKLRESLKDANLVIDVQKKLCEALENLRINTPSEPSSSELSRPSESD